MEHATEHLAKIKGLLIPISLGSMMFLSLGHHLINAWELPAIKLFFLFLIFVPILTVGINVLGKKIILHVSQISKAQFLLYCIGALIIASFITWRTYRAPVSYQKITITPKLSEEQTIGLAEIKANGGIVPLQQAASQNNWQERNGIQYATWNSQPLTVTFKSAADAPLSVLLMTSHQSGSVSVSFGWQIVRFDLHNSDNTNSLIESRATYRGVPNFIFIPALILFDVITFGVAVLFLLVLQHFGQTFDAQSFESTRPLSHHHVNLVILFVSGFIIHLLNALATPLIVGPDSPSFLSGSVHLLQFGNLDGVSMIRGPGTTFLFAPIMFIFPRNPWGIKILLHLIALACIPVMYRIGWQIGRNYWVAFLGGLLALLSPDLMFYSNYVMSDVPNIFCVLAFMTLLISALESANLYWVLSAMLVGSFSVLLRSDNIVMLGIGLLFLLCSMDWRGLRTDSHTQRQLLQIGAAFGIALLPILWWSAHNLNMYGFFGMSNYQGEVLYDGWVYSGDANHLSFSDPDSKAMTTINNAMNKYPSTITDKSGVPTGWEIYPSLLKAGYTPAQSFQLLRSATWDSIKRKPALALKLLFIKYRSGLRPEITFNSTYPLPGDPEDTDKIRASFFDSERGNFPALVILQRQINTRLMEEYPQLYPFWILSCLFLVFLGLFRSPWYIWLATISLTISRIFIPLTLGVAFWRYVLAGWLPAQLIAISGIWVLFYGAKHVFGKRSNFSNAKQPISP